MTQLTNDKQNNKTSQTLQHLDVTFFIFVAKSPQHRTSVFRSGRGFDFFTRK